MRIPKATPSDRAAGGLSSALVVGTGIVSLAVATLAAATLEGALAVADASPVYLLAVVLLAGIGGTWPAVATSVASVVIYDFLFTEPRLTLAVADPAEWLSLLLFLAVAVVIGQMASLLRDRAETAERRTRESQSLVAISRSLATAHTAALARSEIETRVRDDAEMTDVWLALAGEAEWQDPRTVGLRPWDLLRSPGENEPGEWVRVDGGHPPPGPVDQAGGSPASSDGSTSSSDESPDAYRVAIGAEGMTIGWLWATREPGSPLPGRGARRILSLTADQLGAAIRRDELRAEATAAEVARQSDALRAALLDSVSHDLRTPLASIRATAGSLMDPAIEPTPKALRAMAVAIDADAARMSGLVHDLLDMSRIQAGAVLPEPEVFELSEIVEDVLRRSAPVLAGRDVRVELPDDLPAILVDDALFDTAVANVVDNAARYAPAPAAIRLRARGLEGDRVELTVEDGGPGVPAEALELLFERFYRVAPPVGTARHGLGMGLAIARGFVMALGGTMDAGPSELGGLAIRVTVPAAPAGPPEPGTGPDAGETGAAALLELGVAGVADQ